MKRIAPAALALTLAAPAAPVYGHGGGLNRDGCHRETATGGYHCHRGNSDDWERAAVVLGGLVLVGAAIWWWNKRRQAQTLTDLAPPVEERNFGLRYAVDERGDPEAGIFWRLRF